TGKLRGSKGQLRQLQGRQLVDAAVEDQLREHFIFRQHWIRGEAYMRIGHATADCNRDINAVCLGRGDKVQVRIEIAGERYRALAQDDALAENSQASADKTETAYRLDRGDRAGEAD